MATSAPPHPTLDDTLQLIESLFAHKPDKSGQPLHLHSIAVMQRLPDDAPLDIKQAALLHDVVEDTDLTLDDLRARGYTETTVALVELLGPKRTAAEKELTGDEKNDWYLSKILTIGTSGNLWAIRIKLADLEENTREERVKPLSDETKEKLTTKYLGMKAYLRACRDRLENRHELGL